MGTEGEGRPGRTASHPRSFEQLSKGPSDIKPGRTDYKLQLERWALPLADFKAAGGNNGSTLVKVSTVSLRHQHYIWEIAQR